MDRGKAEGKVENIKIDRDKKNTVYKYRSI